MGPFPRSGYSSILRALVMSTLLTSVAYGAKVVHNPEPVPEKPQPQVPQPVAKGEMEFAITPFSNMEHGWHIFEPGYRAVCADNQGVVATARLSIDAAINGETTDGRGAYQGLIIRPATQYLRSGATSGSCELSICLDQNADQPDAKANCREVRSVVGGDSERALAHRGQANYQVNGDKISLQTGAPGLSAWHPAFGFAAPAKSFKDYQSPLVLDLNGDGKLALSDVWNSDADTLIRFDMSLEGRAHPTGWVMPGDGFLAMDRNGNGVIDHAGELFGEYSGAETLGGKTFKSGFEALAVLDSNRDGTIDGRDRDFARVMVWVDENQNGVSETTEIRSLGSQGIRSVSLGHKNLMDSTGAFPLVAGNEVRLTGTFTKADGRDYQIADVWFKQRRHADQATAMTQWMMAPTK